jgi:hypothetical protein
MRARQLGFFGLEGVALYAVIGLAITLAMTLAGSSLAIWYLDGKVQAAEKRTTEAVAARAAEEQSRRGFQAAGAACSASVEALVQAGRERDARHQAELERSRKATQQAQATADAIRTSPRPAGMNECDATRKELDDEVDRRAARPR